RDPRVQSRVVADSTSSWAPSTSERCRKRQWSSASRRGCLIPNRNRRRPPRRARRGVSAVARSLLARRGVVRARIVLSRARPLADANHTGAVPSSLPPRGGNRQALMTTDDARAPGWYSDPSGRHALRWWDGAVWADRVAEATDNDAIGATPAGRVRALAGAQRGPGPGCTVAPAPAAA